MRMPWAKSKRDQLDLLESVPAAESCATPSTPRPEHVPVDGPGDIAHAAVATLCAELHSGSSDPLNLLISQAVVAGERLERPLGRVEPSVHEADRADLAALRAKVSVLSRWSPSGSDGQTHETCSRLLQRRLCVAYGSPTRRIRVVAYASPLVRIRSASGSLSVRIRVTSGSVWAHVAATPPHRAMNSSPKSACRSSRTTRKWFS